MKWLLLLLLVAAPGNAALSERDLAQAVARPAADTRLPAALSFTDQRGGRVSLGEVAGGRPLVLVFADYTCRHVCAPGLALLGGALRDSGLAPGRDYALAVIGLDPKDGPADARQMAAHLGSASRAAHVLTGDARTIAAAARALGYGIAYDEEGDQFAHDASVYAFAADGRLRTLLPELGLSAPGLRAALAGEAIAQPDLVERVARLCYGLGATHGRYGAAIMLGLQASALLLLAGLGAFLWRRRSA